MRALTTDSVSLRDGTAIRLVGWPSVTPTDVAIVLHHGLGEHAERYQVLADGLGDAPVHLWSWDARGHGRSGGPRGDAESLDQFVDDLEELLPQVLERSGASRVVLAGHSLGAAIVSRYLTRRTPHEAIGGVWLSAVPVKVDTSRLDTRIRIAAGRLIRRFSPGLLMANSLPLAGISSVPEEVEVYRKDPLIHDRLSVRLGLSALAAGDEIIAEGERITLPIRMWHGADDPIADPEGSRDLFANVGSGDASLDVIPAARHEVHYEAPAIRDALFAGLRDWLSERFSPA